MAKKTRLYEFKMDIKAAIIARYGTFTAFCIEHSTKGFTTAKLSRVLNPLKNTGIDLLFDICEIIDHELVLVKSHKKAP